MWTIVEHLPPQCLLQGFSNDEQMVEIQNRHAFDPNELAGTWHRPTLKHRQIAYVLQRFEECGLSSRREGLLCMIPALSSKDLLLNDSILDLFPDIRRGLGWEKTAQCYNRLLETRLRAVPTERLCYKAVVAAMDFIEMACEPYTDLIAPPAGLKSQIEDLVARLTSRDFAGIVQRLTPAYTLQHRSDRFLQIFKRYATTEASNRLKQNTDSRRLFRRGQDIAGCMSCFYSKDTRLDPVFAEQTLGFLKEFRHLYYVSDYGQPFVYDINGTDPS